MVEIIIRQGNITKAKTDAIVNAANEMLILGAGVAGAIRARGGQAIQDECDQKAPIQTGEVVSTNAGDLPYKAIIHAVAPRAGMDDWQHLLQNSVRNAIMCADNLGLSSVALPALGTGVFSLPLEPAARLMLDAARQTAEQCSSVKTIVFCLFGERTYELFNALNNNDLISG